MVSNLFTLADKADYSDSEGPCEKKRYEGVMILRVIGPIRTSVEMKSAVSRFRGAEICQMQSTQKSHVGKPVKV